MKLSVIIPGYNNRKDWWIRCVRSVARAAKKVGTYEIVCIDDGSRVPVAVDWFVGIDGVRVIRQENKGLPIARNVGIENSTGEFLTFVDSDDEVREDIYRLAVSVLEKYSADVAESGVTSLFLDDGFAVHDLPDDKNYGALTPADVGCLVKKRLFYYSWNKIFRRIFLDAHQIRFYSDGVPCEDAIFNVALVVNGAKWVTFAYEGYKYYRFDGSLLSSYKPTYVAGTRACTKAWHDYKTQTPGAREALEEYGLGWYDETSEVDLIRGEWTNIWRRKSPFGLKARYDFAKRHSAELGSFTLYVFVKKALLMWARAHCYFRPIQRWHQKRFVTRIGAEVVPLTQELIES